VTKRRPSRPTSTRIEAAANLSGLERVLGGYERFVRRHRVGDDVRADMFVALEEIASNVVRHGAGLGTSRMVVTLTVSRASFQVVIEDDGPKFNPLTARPPDLDLPATRRRAGGLGILLVRKLTECTYSRRRNGNRVRLRRTLAAADAR
jgi:serine/threonine-protein kinase RsbW